MPHFTNPQFQQRYQKDFRFKEGVDRSEKEYERLLEKAQEKVQEKAQDKKAEPVINDSILQKFTTKDNRNVYFWYGHLQPLPGKNTTNLTLAFMLNFQIQADEQFTFVYFNHQTGSSDYYFEFKHIFSLLPLKIIERMQEFILIKPYFYIKACDYVGLGAINKFFNKHYSTLDNCSQLLEKFKIPVHDFVSFVPEQISQEFPPTLKRRASLQNYRINLEGQNMSQEELKEKHEFEISIKSLITKEVYLLQNFQLSDIGIPIIIQLLIHYFRRKPEGLSEQGIFRKSVSIDEQNETLTELGKRNYDYLGHIQNPHLIASLIKKFFNNLKVPIIPYNVFQTLMHNQGVVDKREQLKQIVHGLPSLNFLTLMFLIEFLKKDVVPHEMSSKMTAHNLAICFSPSLMRSEVPSAQDLIYASKSVLVTEMMINDLDYVFGNEEERNRLLKKGMIDSIRQFKKEIRKELNIEETTTTFEGQSHSESLQELGEKLEHIQVGEFGKKQKKVDLQSQIEVPRLLVTRSNAKEIKKQAQKQTTHSAIQMEHKHPQSQTISIEPEKQVRVEINSMSVKRSYFQKKQAETLPPSKQAQAQLNQKLPASQIVENQSSGLGVTTFTYTNSTLLP